jgi:hypothetical protein
MPLPSLHPLPVNPTTGQQPAQPVSARGSGSGPPPASAAGGGGVNREVLKGLQDVVWSDDEVGFAEISRLWPDCRALLVIGSAIAEDMMLLLVADLGGVKAKGQTVRLC